MALNELSMLRQMTVDTMAMQSGCGESFSQCDRKWTYPRLLCHHETPAMHVGLLLYARAGAAHGDVANHDRPQKMPHDPDSWLYKKKISRDFILKKKKKTSQEESIWIYIYN